jgi:hypothetical protein
MLSYTTSLTTYFQKSILVLSFSDLQDRDSQLFKSKDRMNIIIVIIIGWTALRGPLPQKLLPAKVDRMNSSMFL